MLIRANQVKTVENTAGMTLQVPIGYSYLVKCIYVGAVSSENYLTVSVDNYTVGYWRVGGKRGNELGGQRPSYTGINLMKFLVDRGLPFSIPLAEGQKLTLSALDGTGYMQVLYDVYSAGDIKATNPNGTASKRYGFIQYLRESSVITASGDMLLDNAITPSQFPTFPAGAVVSSKMTINLLGIEGSPFADFASANNGFYTTYLKLVKDREVLFDEDRNGFLFLGNSAATGSADYSKTTSLIGSVGEVANPPTNYDIKPPFMFDPPLKFVSGDELLVYLTLVKVGTHTLTENLPDIGLILEVIRD